MRYLTTALFLILAACSSPAAEQPTATPTTTAPVLTTTTSTTTAPSTTTTTLPATTTTTAPGPTTSSVVTPLPLPVEELPHTVDSMTVGDAGLLYHGSISPTPRDHPNEGVFWHYNGIDWARTVVADIAPPEDFGSYPQTTNLVSWNGGYLGFIQPDWISEDTAPPLPSVLRSEDGRTWTTEPIFHRAAAGSPLTGVLPTPESPPWPGAAGISHVTTTETEIIAVGWIVTAPGESTATVWRSSDGAAWTVSALPNAQWPNEWAAEVAVGEDGWLVSGSGPVHSTDLLWYSPDGEDWTSIGDAFQSESQEAWWSFHQLASGADGLVVNAGDLSAEYAEQLWRSSDGQTWTMVGDRTVEPMALVSDGAIITRMIRGEDATIIDSSRDGETWTPVASIDITTDLERIWLHQLDLGLIGSTITVTELKSNEDYTETNARIWIDAPVMDVVLVEQDDVLNVRNGVMGDIVGSIDPAATGIQTTGRSDGNADSLWLEIIHDGQLGWVNSLYLAEPVEGSVVGQTDG